MATIERRRDGTGRLHYRARVRLRGTVPLTATFERLVEARDWARETEAAIRSGRYRIGEARRHTVAELIDRYVEEIFPRLKPGERKQRSRQLAFWRRTLGHLLLAELRAGAIVDARRHLTCGPATSNRYLAALSHAVSIAVREWEWLEDHPVRKIKRLPESRGRLRFLSEEERDGLLAACQASREPRLYPLVLLALATGARQGELLRMRWGDLDLARGRVLIPETKSGEPRSVPVVPRAVNVVRAMPRRLGSNLLFAGRAGRALFPREAWEQALVESGIEDFRFHDLRHSAASYLAMSGASIRDIQSLLGHKTAAISHRYAHLTDSHLDAVAARMAERFLPE